MIDIDDHEYACPKCGSEECTRETCWQCSGEGGFDEHDYDPINYGPGEETTECEECNGEGSYWICRACIDAKMSEEAKK